MFVLLLMVAPVVLSGCATIINGSYQQIEVSSLPAGAHVMVDTTAVGITPLSVKIQRRSEHTIRVGLAGYEEKEYYEFVWFTRKSPSSISKEAQAEKKGVEQKR